MNCSHCYAGDTRLHRIIFLGGFAPSVFFRDIRTLLFAIFLILPVSLTCSGDSQATRSWPRTQEPYEIFNKKYYPIPSSDGYIENGTASWYGPNFHGLKTSNGEIYNMYEMTAAHKILPMDTMLLVTNLDNGRKTVVRVNDRGPFVQGRILDLSYKAAKTLEIVENGTARVQIVALAEGEMRGLGQQPILHYKNLSIGEFYVQIGSFAQRFNAARLQKRFTDAGHTTVIQKTFSPEPILYRVHVYVGKTLQDARRAEKALVERGYRGAFIIAR
jgi:rare lipoprotein A